MITEIYGYKHARRAIWLGLLLSLLFIGYSQAIIEMPSPNYAVNNIKFNTLLSVKLMVFIASNVCYFSSEPFSSYIVAKLKVLLKGGYIGIRYVLAIIMPLSIGSFFFNLLQFNQTVKQTILLTFISSIIPVLLVCLPISIYFTKKIKKIEELDIYDTQTNFNFFKLEASYVARDNEFNR